MLVSISTEIICHANKYEGHGTHLFLVLNIRPEYKICACKHFNSYVNLYRHTFIWQPDGQHNNLQ